MPNTPVPVQHFFKACVQTALAGAVVKLVAILLALSELKGIKIGTDAGGVYVNEPDGLTHK